MGLTACALVAWKQVGYWRDTVTLFQRALDVTADNATAHNAMGDALTDLQHLDDRFS